MRFVTKGIVLRETQTREADKILIVLTDREGKLPVIARGARRRRSRIAAASELLAYSELVLYERRGWYLLDEASTISLFDGVRRDVLLLALGSYFAEMAEAVTAERVPSDEILSLLLNALYALDTLGKPPEMVRAAYELKLLALSGYEPRLDACAVCGASPPAEPVFDAREGVILCAGCATGRAVCELDPGAFAAMRHVVSRAQRTMLAFRLRGDTLARFSRACEAFAAAQLDRPFQTLEFYKRMRNDNGQYNLTGK